MENYVIRPIPLYKGPGERSVLTYRGGTGPVETYGYVWYIKGPAEHVVVDAGITAELMVLGGYPGKENVQSLEDGLGKQGLEPGDIDIVIVTHLHHDHIGLAHKFTKAKFVVQKRELDFARNPHPLAAKSYRREYFEGLNFEVIDGDKEIVEGVKVLLTPGHSPGAQSVAIETAKGTAVITGFCCGRENFEPPEEARGRTPVLAPGVHTDALAAYDSLIRVKEIGQIIIPLHDPEFAYIEEIP